MPDPNDSFSRQFIEDLIMYYGADKITSKKGKVAYLVGNVVIKLPKGNKKISYDIIEEIAIEQLGITSWDIDYWIGENQ